jgi:hypothetical protein
LRSTDSAKKIYKNENNHDDNTGITDSIDLDNSDELNKIIQRYENMLSNEKKELTKSSLSNSKGTLEESWG